MNRFMGRTALYAMMAPLVALPGPTEPASWTAALGLTTLALASGLRPVRTSSDSGR